MTLVETVRTWGRMVKFSHSVFALPFALSGATLAAATHGITPRQVLWILAAMVGARNAAMGFNRLADHAIDAENPRTAARELPRGVLSRGAVWAFTIALAALFVTASFALNRACAILSPIALAIIFAYSYTKRFTWASHLVLGLALGIAPIGGWLAIAGTLAWPPVLLAAAVLTWVAGFDVVYACQDVDFDRRSALHSIPARFGMATSLNVARALHVVAILFLAGVGLAADLHPLYWAGLAVIGGILAWVHSFLKAGDLSKSAMTFFNANGLVSLAYFAVVLACVLAR